MKFKSTPLGIVSPLKQVSSPSPDRTKRARNSGAKQGVLHCIYICDRSIERVTIHDHY